MSKLDNAPFPPSEIVGRPFTLHGLAGDTVGTIARMETTDEGYVTIYSTDAPERPIAGYAKGWGSWCYDIDGNVSIHITRVGQIVARQVTV